MKVRVVQENNIVVVTLISLSDKLNAKFKKRSSVELIKGYNDNYCGIILRATNIPCEFGINDGYLFLSKKSILKSDYYNFKNVISASDWVRKLRNSINLINRGTELQLSEANSFLNDTSIEILD